MAESSGPFDSAAMGESDWSRMARAWTQNGVYGSTHLEVTSSGLTATIAAGEGIVQGFWYRTTATIDKSISANNAGGGTTRIDRIVLRADPSNNQVITDVLVGTASASPSAPALTQVQGGIWEISLAQCWVANGAATMTVIDERALVTSLHPVPSVAFKTGLDQSVSSANTGTTFVDITGLVLPVMANSSYDGKIKIFGSAGTTGDMKLGYTAPSGAEVIHSPMSAGSASGSGDWRSAAFVDLSSPGVVGGQGVGVRFIAIVEFTLVTGNTPGLFKAQYAQNISHSDNTTVYTKSSLRLLKG